MRPMGMLSRILTAEHFKQDGGDLLRGAKRDRSKFPYQSLPVDGAQLVKCGLSGFSLKAQRNPRGIGAHRSGHGDNNDSLQILVHLIGRDHQARPRLFYLGPMGGIKRHQPDLVSARRATHHSHSSTSNSLAAAVSRSSSSIPAEAPRNFSAQPSRGTPTGEMIRDLFSTRKSTASPKPSCSISGFGMRIPREFPIRTKSVFISNYIVITVRKVTQAALLELIQDAKGVHR
jgi:hypothetical protein